MHPLKNLNVWGDGGFIVTQKEKLAKKLFLIRNHGLKIKINTVALKGINDNEILERMIFLIDLRDIASGVVM